MSIENAAWAALYTVLGGALVKSIEVVIPKKIDAAAELREELRKDLASIKKEMIMMDRELNFYQMISLRSASRTYRVIALIEGVFDIIGNDFPKYVDHWRKEFEEIKTEFKNDCDAIQNRENIRKDGSN